MYFALFWTILNKNHQLQLPKIVAIYTKKLNLKYPLSNISNNLKIALKCSCKVLIYFYMNNFVFFHKNTSNQYTKIKIKMHYENLAILYNFTISVYKNYTWGSAAIFSRRFFSLADSIHSILTIAASKSTLSTQSTPIL